MGGSQLYEAITYQHQLATQTKPHSIARLGVSKVLELVFGESGVGRYRGRNSV